MYVLSIGFKTEIIGTPLKFKVGTFLFYYNSRCFFEKLLLLDLLDAYLIYFEILLFDFSESVSILTDLFNDWFISLFDLKNLAVFFGSY